LDSLVLGTAQCEALRERLLEVGRHLVSQCGPDVTLSEIVHHAQRPADASQERSIGDEAIVASLLEQRLGDLVEVVRAADPRRRPESSATWTRAVRELLSGELDRPALSLQAAARALAVSVRTLQRRLADEGTSWRAEIDAARKERAARASHWHSRHVEQTALHARLRRMKVAARAHLDHAIRINDRKATP
ncbi:MAG: hypothetical protein ACRDLR_02635, partial [Gaiellaceae bacterium]